MSETATAQGGGALPSSRLSLPRRGLLVWLALGVLIAMMLAGKAALPLAFTPPKEMLPLDKWISAFMTWLVEDAGFGLFSFRDLTRFLAWIVEQPYTLLLGLLANGVTIGRGDEAVTLLPPFAWVSVTALAVLLGKVAGGWRLGLFAGACFVYLAIFGQWQSAMVTLASILIAVPLGCAGGVALGLAGYRWPAFERVLTPILDLMQTVPVFAYLVPILFLFGFGPVAAIIATVIYAMPPMVRITMVALRQVPAETRELGRMTGCTPRQLTWKVMLPSAREGLMVGVNQVIMLSLNMVIIASMIGAGGLGYDVLTALRSLKIGQGLEAGIAIVVLAIALDRLSQAFSIRPQSPWRDMAGLPPWRRHPTTALALALLLGGWIVGLALPFIEAWPEQWRLTTGPIFDEVVAWLNVTLFDTLEAIKTSLLVNVMVPVRRFLLALPYTGVILVLAALGYALGGLRLAVTVGALALFIAAVGAWEKAMITVYLCGVSVAIAILIGFPLGILAAGGERRWRVAEAVVDTLQTLPSFVYLIPVVMLFRVGDFSAMIAVVAFALAPVIRYTGYGLRKVDPALIEAAVVAGCTPWQVLTKVRLKLALPEFLLGLNQTIMLALSMLVITALVGTRDLGQDVYIALAKAQTGPGIVAGLCIAALAIIADRLITAWARRLKNRMGIA